MPTHPLIPYGRADFKKIRLEGCLYVDKTRFVRRIEAERHVFFICPRRFGKTCWLALLECYYDRTEKEYFERVFAGADIGRDPTADRSRYVVVFFDFSAIRKALETLEQRFTAPTPTGPSPTAAASTATSSPPSRPAPAPAAWSGSSSPGSRRSPWCSTTCGNRSSTSARRES